jgi:hypothetical protein
MSETVVGLPWAADSCPWVGKLRTVLPLSDVQRQCGAVGVDSRRVEIGKVRVRERLLHTPRDAAAQRNNNLHLREPARRTENRVAAAWGERETLNVCTHLPL